MLEVHPLDTGQSYVSLCRVSQDVPRDKSPQPIYGKQMDNATLRKQIFRPAINGLEVLEIAAILQKYIPSSDISKKFAVQAFKINQGINEAAYVKKSNIVEELNIEAAEQIKIGKENTQVILHKREKAYEKWLETPELCTEEEIGLSEAYRVDNGLMSEDELIEIEMRKFNTPKKEE